MGEYKLATLCLIIALFSTNLNMNQSGYYEDMGMRKIVIHVVIILLEVVACFVNSQNRIKQKLDEIQ